MSSPGFGTESSDPLALAREWLEWAWSREPADANAAALATVDSEMLPNVRMVLVKEIAAGAEGGAVFYTNLGSAKAREVGANPQAALVFHWKSCDRQLRMRGAVESVVDAEADAYFASRPYQSRIGAWASRQSSALPSRATLLASAAKFAAKYPSDPPRPEFWHGFRIRPLEIELWSAGEFRLHNRFRWRRRSPDASDWTRERLFP